MYSPRVVTEHIQNFESENHWLPVFHTYDEVLGFSKYIDSLIRLESNTKSSQVFLTKKISASRQKEIRHWIQNEQVLCGLDSNYWERNYAWVCDEKGQIFKFHLDLN